jgi:hypothetical protein
MPDRCARLVDLGKRCNYLIQVASHHANLLLNSLEQVLDPVCSARKGAAVRESTYAKIAATPASQYFKETFLP